MSDELTASQYWEEIKSIAEEAKETVRDGYDLNDYLHEIIDDHSYVIYHSNAQRVIAISPNDDAGIQSGLVDANQAIKDGGLDSLYSQLAYGAMNQDVYDELGGWEPHPERNFITADLATGEEVPA